MIILKEANMNYAWDFENIYDIIKWRDDYGLLILTSVLIIVPAIMYVLSWANVPISTYVPLLRAGGIVAVIFLAQCAFNEEVSKNQLILTVVIAGCIYGISVDMKKNKIKV